MNARVQPVAIAEAKTSPLATHEVRNQARPPLGFNAFDDDRALSGLIAKIVPWAKDKLSALGAHAGCESVQEAARLANEHEPKLLTHDRYGNRNDWVEFHPAWHQLMALAFQSEVHSLAWSTSEPNGHLARAALIGYAMTEKQGGSDLRETQTTARFIERGAHGEIYSITGHKWFFSVPVADGFYTLAQTESGVSCLFVPRLLPDGSANRIFIQRLKDKCGNRSNASSEIEYHDTWSILVGEEGRGIREILSHAHLTRLDFAVGSAGLMRQALNLALNHAQTRTAFGKPMSELPMQRNVLADLALESEAAMLGALRVARATDGLQTSEHERLLARVATPVVKFWNCQRAPAFSYECLQVHGGNGFIMENAMARLYREAPLNSIWEGTSNMMCMDVLRAMQRDARCRDAFVDELRASSGLNRIYDSSTEDLADRLRARYPDDGHARALVTRMAHALQAAEMLQHGDADAADLFVRSRLGMDGMHVFGALPSSEGLARIVERASVIRH